MKRLSFAGVLLLVGVALGLLIQRSVLQGQQGVAPATPRELTSYRDVVKQVLPAVVSIEAKGRTGRPMGRRPGIFNDPRQQENQPQQDFGGNSPDRLGFGSGVLVDARGVILTNNHVVEGSEEVLIQLGDGRKFTSRDIKMDAKTDLAIVRIQAQNLPFLRLGNSDSMEIGDRVLAVGAPFGLVGSVTHGIVSGKGRSLRMNFYEDFLQTDAAINPGNSGGPLVNLQGEIIGINSAIKTRSGGFQGVGLAISSNLARDVMQKLLKDGVVRRGYLGIQVQEMDNQEIATRLGIKPGQGGVLVSRAFSDAPGAKGGIVEGDVILSVNGDTIRDGRDLQFTIARQAVGQPVPVRILRDGQVQQLDVTLTEQPDDLGTIRVPVPRPLERELETLRVDSLGFDVAEMDASVADRLGFAENARGALVTRVLRSGPAALAGVRPGMLITRVDKQKIKSAEAFVSSVKEADLQEGVLLQVQSPQTGTTFVLVKSKDNR